jgi:hypothetical protein
MAKQFVFSSACLEARDPVVLLSAFRWTPPTSAGL